MSKHEDFESLTDYLHLAWEQNALVDKPEIRQALKSAELFLRAASEGTADPVEWNPRFWVHLCQVSQLPDTMAHYSLRLLIQQCLRMNGLDVSFAETGQPLRTTTRPL